MLLLPGRESRETEVSHGADPVCGVRWSVVMVEPRANWSFLKTFSVYGLGTVGRRLVGIALIPVYTRVLSPSDYGILALLGVFMAVYVKVADLGISPSILRFYIGEKDETGRRDVLSGCLSLLALALVPSLVLAAASTLVSRALLDSPALWYLIALCIAACWLDLLIKIPMATVRARQDADLYVRIELLLTGAILILSILLVVFLRMGVLGIILAQVVANAGAAVWLLIRHLPHPLPKPKRAVMASILRFSVPFVPSGLSQFVLRLSDRYVLKLFEPLSAVGLYTIGYRLGEGITTATEAFWIAWGPFAFRTAQEDGGRQRLADVGTTWFGVTMAMALMVALFGREALLILTPPAYHGAARVVPVIAIGIALFSFYPVAEISLQISGRTGRIPIVNGFAAALNVALNLVLIPRMHMMGAAWSTAIAYGVQLFGILWIGQRSYAIPLPYGRMLAGAAVSLAAGFAGIEADRRLALLPGIAAKIVLLGFAVAIIFLLRLISAGRVRNLIRSLRPSAPVQTATQTEARTSDSPSSSGEAPPK
jgi:O-antigen/teichoic acid export membrane protein